MAVSFHKQSEGLDHQIKMPDVPMPESLRTDEELLEPLKKSEPLLFNAMYQSRPIEFRPVEFINPLEKSNNEPFRHVWLKAKGKLNDELRVHQEVFAYASDYNLLGTALLPHGSKDLRGKYFLASLDHGMWFHREFRADE